MNSESQKVPEAQARKRRSFKIGKFEYRHVRIKDMEWQHKSVVFNGLFMLWCSFAVCMSSYLNMRMHVQGRYWSTDLLLISMGVTFGHCMQNYFCGKFHSRKVINRWADDAIHHAVTLAEAERIKDQGF